METDSTSRLFLIHVCVYVLFMKRADMAAASGTVSLNSPVWKRVYGFSMWQDVTRPCLPVSTRQPCFHTDHITSHHLHSRRLGCVGGVHRQCEVSRKKKTVPISILVHSGDVSQHCSCGVGGIRPSLVKGFFFLFVCLFVFCFFLCMMRIKPQKNRASASSSYSALILLLERK